ncbi:hypothetical protein GCM10022224_026810 [Nonomuraea antimicrobica]|uniref:Uncharacterized protein n=1 Tax=Nonomuraea antimicrobica TaxID=561173 RepID=A0ABP7BKH4_9ACTN
MPAAPQRDRYPPDARERPDLGQVHPARIEGYGAATALDHRIASVRLRELGLTP